MKTRKLLSLILALVMVLSVVSFAGAATFEDVEGDVAPAVSRLVGLGILTGYPDGTFKPGNTITRAEFATVAVRALGLEKTADLLANVPSKFSDVKVTDWFNKYVNVAAAQGILNGYPDGTFKPNNNITQAEALAIVLRLLGYSDNLPGNWPYNYVMQANRLGMLDDDFTTSAAATRGGVAVLVNSALNQNVVTFKDGAFDAGQTPVTFIASVLNGAIEGTLSAPKVVVSTAVGTPYDSMNISGVADPVPVAKNVEILGGTFDSLANHKVIYTTKNGVAVAIQVVSTAVTGKVTSVIGSYVTIGGNVVQFAENAVDQDPNTDDNFGELMNKQVIAYVYNGLAYLAQEIVDPSVSGTVTGKSTSTVGYTTTNKLEIRVGTVLGDYVVPATAVITINGAAATFADIKVNDNVVFTFHTKGTTNYIDTLAVWNVTVTGVVNSWTRNAAGRLTTVTIDGQLYEVSPTSTDASLTGDLNIGFVRTFYVDAQNKIIAVAEGEQAATSVVGTLAGTSIGSSSTGPVYYLTLTNGVAYDITAVIKSTSDATQNELYLNKVKALFRDLMNLEGAAVKISYNAAGAVIRVEVFQNNAVVDRRDLETLKIETANTTYTLNGKAQLELPDEDPNEQLRVVWDGVTGTAAQINVVVLDYSNSDSKTYKVIGTSVSTAGGTTTYSVTIEANDDNWDYDGTTHTFDIVDGSVIMKNGAVSNFNALAINDLIDFAIDSGNPDKIVYIEAFTPTN